MDDEPWRPDSEGFLVGVSCGIRGMRHELREAGQDGLVDFTSAPRRKLRWTIVRRRFTTERKRYQAELDAWYVRARSEAGLPRVPTLTDLERLRKSRRPRHADPTVDSALERLHELLDELPLTQYGLGVDERDVIPVKIRPFRTRHVRRIKETCGAASVEIVRVARN